VAWGNALDDSGDFDGAIQKYRESVAISPRNADAYLQWGVALSRRGDFEQAITKQTRALALNPGSAVILRARGFAYRRWGVALESSREWQKALEKLRLSEQDFVTSGDFAEAAQTALLIARAEEQAGHLAMICQHLDRALKYAQNAKDTRIIQELSKQMSTYNCKGQHGIAALDLPREGFALKDPPTDSAAVALLRPDTMVLQVARFQLLP
jgi:tetratricopeptide (TPR) repeat protein